MAIAYSVAFEGVYSERISQGWSLIPSQIEGMALRHGDSTAHSRMNAINSETKTVF